MTTTTTTTNLSLVQSARQAALSILPEKVWVVKLPVHKDKKLQDLEHSGMIVGSSEQKMVFYQTVEDILQDPLWEGFCPIHELLKLDDGETIVVGEWKLGQNRGLFFAHHNTDRAAVYVEERLAEQVVQLIVNNRLW